jgi:hypothetical protein
MDAAAQIPPSQLLGLLYLRAQPQELHQRHMGVLALLSRRNIIHFKVVRFVYFVLQCICVTNGDNKFIKRPILSVHLLFRPSFS